MRNQTKFEESEFHFNEAKKEVDSISNDLLEKIENLRINLSVKFFKNIQVNFYASMDEMFAPLGNVANELESLQRGEKNKQVQNADFLDAISQPSYV